MLIVELLHRHAATGEPPEAVLYLVHMLAQFGLDCRRWLQVVEGNFQRCIHVVPPDASDLLPDRHRGLLYDRLFVGVWWRSRSSRHETSTGRSAKLLHSRPVGEVGLRTADIGPVLAQGCSHVHYLWFIRRGRKAEAMSEALAR